MTENFHFKLTLEQLKKLERQLEKVNTTELDICVDSLYGEADFDLYSNNDAHFITTLLTLVKE